MTRRTFGLGLAVLLASSSCASSLPALANTRPSPEALAGAVLEALVQRDRAMLDALALNEQEFRDHVWPELPASRPERNLPFSYVWGDLHQKSEGALAQTLAARGGQRYDLVSVRGTGETTDYQTYRVHRETVLVVRDPAGVQQELKLFGSMLEKNGMWKVFSYVND